MAITRTRRYLILSSFTEMDAADAHRMQAKMGRHIGRNKVQTIASQFLAELGRSAPQPIRGEEFLRRLKE